MFLKTKLKKIILFNIILILILISAIFFSVSRHYWEGLGDTNKFKILLSIFSLLILGPLSLYIIFVEICLYFKRKYKLSFIILTIVLIILLFATPKTWLFTVKATNKIILPKRTYTTGFLKRIEQNCSSEQIRFWALNFINNYSDYNKNWEFYKKDEKWKFFSTSLSDIKYTLNIKPNFINEIYPEGNYFRVERMEHNSNKYANVHWRHCGLYVGTTNLVLKENSQVLKWKDGIYIWSNP